MTMASLPPVLPAPTPIPRGASPTDRTDLGNSHRFVVEHGEALRYVGSWGKWLDWDGKRWSIDAVGRAEHRAKETVRGMYSGVSKEILNAKASLDRAEATGDPDLVTLQKDRMKATGAMFNWALKSHDAARIRAIVTLAKSAPELAVTHAQLDADPWALNVTNGRIDLRTGKLHAHRPGDLITKLASVAYDPAAECPTWERFLSQAMGGNVDLLSFIRRMTGYALTGVIREHVLGFLFGSGANGKSTYINTMHSMLGDYATRAPRGLLFTAFGSKHETELTTLFGARMVSCSEVDEAATFDEALVKDLTGGDPITARRMREDHWTFTPSHKLFLAGNHKPRVKGNDEGIWRRIRLIPWTVTIPLEQRDTELPEKLRVELPGILAWAVRGCLEWQQHGLGEPIEVTQATAAYRDESDPMREFFDLHCVLESEARTPRRHIRERYVEYCKDVGAEPLHAKRFSEGLRRRGVLDGVVKYMGKVMDGWKGVRLATDRERDERADSEENDAAKAPRAHKNDAANGAPEDGREPVTAVRSRDSESIPSSESENCFSDFLGRADGFAK